MRTRLVFSTLILLFLFAIPLYSHGLSCAEILAKLTADHEKYSQNLQRADLHLHRTGILPFRHMAYLYQQVLLKDYGTSRGFDQRARVIKQVETSLQAIDNAPTGVTLVEIDFLNKMVQLLLTEPALREDLNNTYEQAKRILSHDLRRRFPNLSEAEIRQILARGEFRHPSNPALNHLVSAASAPDLIQLFFVTGERVILGEAVFISFQEVFGVQNILAELVRRQGKIASENSVLACLLVTEDFFEKKKIEHAEIAYDFKIEDSESGPGRPSLPIRKALELIKENPKTVTRVLLAMNRTSLITQKISKEKLDEFEELLRSDGVVGLDSKGPERSHLNTPNFRYNVQNLLARMINVVADRIRQGTQANGPPHKVFKFHVGEGIHTNPSFSSIRSAQQNITTLLDIFEAQLIKYEGDDTKMRALKSIEIRLSHATHISPEDLNRIVKLRKQGLNIAFDFPFSSNIVTRTLPTPQFIRSTRDQFTLVRPTSSLAEEILSTDVHPALAAIYHQADFYLGTDGETVYSASLSKDLGHLKTCLERFVTGKIEINVADSSEKNAQIWKKFEDLSPEKQKFFIDAIEHLNTRTNRYFDRVRGAPRPAIPQLIRPVIPVTPKKVPNLSVRSAK